MKTTVAAEDELKRVLTHNPKLNQILIQNGFLHISNVAPKPKIHNAGWLLAAAFTIMALTTFFLYVQRNTGLEGDAIFSNLNNAGNSSSLAEVAIARKDPVTFSFSGATAPAKIAFLAGVNWLDSEICKKAKQESPAENFHSRISQLTHSLTPYRSDSDRLTRELENQFRAQKLDSVYHFGIWIEASRIASCLKDIRFFQDGKAGEFQKLLAELQYDPVALRLLDQAKTILQNNPSSENFDQLNREFESIILLNY